MWGVGVSYINYGQIDSYDAQGRDLGEINASEYAVYVSKSHMIGPYSMGVTMKFVGSNLSGYNAYRITPIYEFTFGCTVI